jgi:ComF family protein
LIKRILNLLYPRTCVICDKALNIDYTPLDICEKCVKDIKYVKEPICKRCGKQIYEEGLEYCHDCGGKRHFFEQGRTLFQYEYINKSVYKFKYHNHRLYGEFYGKEMSKKYADIIKEWKIDVVIPVPIHKKRLKKRGFNQSEIIAKELSKNLSIPMNPYILERIKKTIPQKKLNDVLRKKNIENAFKISKDIVKYKYVILVDDIYTTGATLDECARILMEAGVLKVYFVTVCSGDGI